MFETVLEWIYTDSNQEQEDMSFLFRPCLHVKSVMISHPWFKILNIILGKFT